MKYTIDTEFDGHNGPLISMALVPEEGQAYYVYTEFYPTDPWVAQNVMPLVDAINVPLNVRFDVDQVNWWGLYIRDYLKHVMRDETPHIIADSPVDIARFCQVISTNSTGGWTSCGFEKMTFEVLDVDCWPNNLGEQAVQHNAYWDAVALWEKIRD